MKHNKISIIVAIADGNGIGYKNGLLCHLPEDLRRFKKITMGHTLLMGRRTWESLPVKPLPGRKSIVLTDIRNEVFPGANAAYSIEEALSKCPGDEEIFVIGGASVYEQFLPIANKLYITRIYRKYEADAFFPSIPESQWKLTESEIHESHEKEFPTYAYLTYIRKT